MSLGAKFVGDDFLTPGSPRAGFAPAVNGSYYYDSGVFGRLVRSHLHDGFELSAGGYFHAQAVGSEAGINISRDIWFQSSRDQ